VSRGHAHPLRRRLLAVAAVAGLAAGVGCRPLDRAARPIDAAGPTSPAAVARGAYLYATYCARCHGTTGAGDGPLASAFGLKAANLCAPVAADVSDAALLARLTHGTPLEVSPLEAAQEPRAVDALAAYLPRLGNMDGEVLRAGRVVYEESCAACHGAYGRPDTAVAHWVGASDLIAARDRYSDAALARISELGIGAMPPLLGAFDRTELRALTAYIRNLSDGFALYDTRCAACHGDDGQGLYSRDLIPPATAAPALAPAYPRDQLLTRLRRERGVMPHFTDLAEPRLRDVVAYLRLAACPPRGTPAVASHGRE